MLVLKLLSLIMKSLAQENMDMVVARQIDNGKRKLLNPCQRVNTSHELSYHGKFFPCSCSVFLFQLNFVLQQVHYLKKENAAGHEQILSSQKGFNGCCMRVL